MIFKWSWSKNGRKKTLTGLCWYMYISIKSNSDVCVCKEIIHVNNIIKIQNVIFLVSHMLIYKQMHLVLFYLWPVLFTTWIKVAYGLQRIWMACFCFSNMSVPQHSRRKIWMLLLSKHSFLICCWKVSNFLFLSKEYSLDIYFCFCSLVTKTSQLTTKDLAWK